MNKKLQKPSKKQVIKIPNNIEVFYCRKKKIIIFKGSASQKSLKINSLLTVYLKEQYIEIVSDTKKKLSNSDKKKVRTIKQTTVSLIKCLLVETIAIMYQKLILVGVGYRIFPVENFENCLLLLRLGYSHPIYFKIPRKITIFTLKLTKLFLYSNSYQQVTYTASQIRKNKVPEPYKGKGILYENETVIIKEGKKI